MEKSNIPFLFAAYSVVSISVDEKEHGYVNVCLEDESGDTFTARVMREDANDIKLFQSFSIMKVN